MRPRDSEGCGIEVGSDIARLPAPENWPRPGVQVRILNRGRCGGGRMTVRHVDSRPVDVGASYLTARDPVFQSVVGDWRERGLVGPWTNTFDACGLQVQSGIDAGPLRYAARGGLRSLVEDLATRVAVGSGPVVDGETVDAGVLATPDPHALDILATSQARWPASTLPSATDCRIPGWRA